MNYYNEFDPFAAKWLRNLAQADQIPGGTVDERSIKDVRGADLSGVRQAHFFAGIGGWPLALRIAGWPEDREVWTGSCPCQPFSLAGKRKGVEDERHLWPEFLRLIRERRPATVFGEQVASKDGRLWLDGVRTDLEALGYRVGAADLCAAGLDAPHRRMRLFWVADTQKHRQPREQAVWNGRAGIAHGSGVGHSESDGREPRRPESGRPILPSETSAVHGSGMTDSKSEQGGWLFERRIHKNSGAASGGHWADREWLHCQDGKARRIKPGLCPVVDGVPGRVGLLRGYGNAIVPQVAAEFIKAYRETE